MTNHDLTETYIRLKSLEQAITAFSEVSQAIPSDDRYAAFMVVMVDRLENEFSALQAEIIRTWGRVHVNVAS